MTGARVPSSWFVLVTALLALATLVDFAVGLATKSPGVVGVFKPQAFLAATGLVSPWLYVLLLGLAGVMLLVSWRRTIGAAPSPILIGVCAAVAVLCVLATAWVAPGGQGSPAASGVDMVGAVRQDAVTHALIAATIFVLAGVAMVSLAIRRRQQLVGLNGERECA